MTANIEIDKVRSILADVDQTLTRMNDIVSKVDTTEIVRKVKRQDTTLHKILLVLALIVFGADIGLFIMYNHERSNQVLFSSQDQQINKLIEQQKKIIELAVEHNRLETADLEKKK